MGIIHVCTMNVSTNESFLFHAHVGRSFGRPFLLTYVIKRLSYILCSVLLGI